MKALGLLAFALSVPAFFVAGGWFVMGPLHDWEGKRNTQYSSNFSWQNFDKITNGMSQAAVTNLLGAELGGATDDAYPGWALHDSSGKTYASNSTFQIEWLYFSQPKRTRVDYEWVQVVFGPDRTVIDKNSYVTD